MGTPAAADGNLDAALAAVEALPDRAALPGEAPRAAALAAALLASGADPVEAAAALTRLSDALVRRLLAWAAAELGPAPAEWAWLALGSEGRLEQTLGADQDHALVYGQAGASRREWFVALARRVGRDLEAAGVPPCRGGHVAANLHGTRAEWAARLEDAVAAPRPHEAELLFDFRPVAGALPLDALEAVVARAGRSEPFLAALARQALLFSPPSPLLLRLRARKGGLTFEVKRHGLLPLVALARCHALEAGSLARSTSGRLAAAAAAGLLDARAERALQAALRLLLRVRCEHHLRLRARGDPPGDRVAFAELSDADRRGLVAAAAALKRWQTETSLHHQVER